MQVFIPTIIFCVAITLALGLYSGRYIKDAKDYIIGNTPFSPLMLSLTLIATLIASGDFTSPNRAAARGITDAIVMLGFVIALLLVGRLIAPRMVYFNDCYTPGDMMHKLYGKEARLLTGFVGCLFSLILITNQLRAIKYLNAYLLGMPPTTLILIVVMCVIAYTVMGGMQGVIKTDALQFVLVFLVLLLITRVLLAQIGGFEPLFKQIPDEQLALSNSNTTLFTRIEGILFWPALYVLSLPMVMRVLLLPKNKRQVQKTYYYTIAFYMTIRVMFLIIGLSVYSYFQNSPIQLNEALQTESLIGYLTNHLFSQSRLMQALLFLGMLFALASTLDSYVHAVGVEAIVTLSHFSKSLKPLRRLENSETSIKALHYIRLATLLIGAIASFIVLTDIDLPFRFFGDTIVLGNIILLPLIAGILGLKTDKKSLWVFCISYLLTFSVFYGFTGFYAKGSLFKFGPFWLAMGVASTLYFIIHYRTNNGFVLVQNDQSPTHHYKSREQSGLSALISCISTPSQLAQMAQNKVKSHGRNPLLFVIFILTFWLITSYDTTKSIAQIFSFYTLVHGVGLVLCTLTMALSWAKHNPYYDLLWLVTVGYCIPYATTLTCLTDINNSSSIYSLFVAFIILLTCVNWQVFFILTSLGISAALFTYRLLAGQFLPVMQFETAWHLVLALVSIGVAAFFFSRKTEKHQLAKLQTTKLLGGSIGHEVNNYLQMGAVVGDFITSSIKKKQIKPLQGMAAQEAEKGYFIPKATVETLQFMGEELTENSEKASDSVGIFTRAMIDKVSVEELKHKNISIKSLVEVVMKDSYFQQKDVAKCIELDIKDDFVAPMDKSILAHIITNLVKNALNHGKATQVQITLHQPTRSLRVSDNGLGIPNHRLPYVFNLFHSGGSGSGIGLALVKYLMASFGGSVHCTSSQGTEAHTEFVINFL